MRMYVPEGTHEQVEIMEYNTRAVQNRQLPGETEITVSTSQFIDRLSNVAAPQGMHIIYIYIYILSSSCTQEKEGALQNIKISHNC